MVICCIILPEFAVGIIHSNPTAVVRMESAQPIGAGAASDRSTSRHPSFTGDVRYGPDVPYPAIHECTP
jgi:hypothetical protein